MDRENDTVQYYIPLTLTTNLHADNVIKRTFPSTDTLKDLKGKLELITGATMDKMQLEIRTAEGECIKSMTDDSKTLDQYQIESGSVIHIHVMDPETTYDDEAGVGFQLSDQDYESRKESARQFLIQNKLGKYDETKIQSKNDQEVRESALVSEISVGSRCEVRIQGAPSRRGEVKYVGEVHFKPGHWVGIGYDEPVGKNDGTIDEKRYFETRPMYGGFVRPSTVQVGDYPELGLLDDLDEI